MDKEQTRSRIFTYSGVDAMTAVVVVIIGAVMMVDNHRIGVAWGSGGPEPGYFPYHIGMILCFAGVAVFLKSVFGKHRNNEVFVTWPCFRLVLMVLLPTAVYVLFIQFLGIYVASTLFIGGFMRVLGKTGWLKTVLISVGVSVLLFWMFEIQFMVPLPKGPLELWLGY
ncbi:tripartite tricarboxylate transporter TctB family protein [Allopusillimonas soli]|uniref:Tripartite tricarboxylate transporter TctB family protein n=1 Tax=Allopusillimonas soli TaxID=659016 RepID=A0A853FBY6_9BURK|nr:tripartite tricarboxylate transporter TctB family protein [Allopusillimonas soli]NYT37152.1 tripartite tricarboxylate transporter TctB family protein [Allopusillimonas soli]TEA75576.1 tripartite tricarboxylate transporter TctB family protein [Allopusillimonas soli]